MVEGLSPERAIDHRIQVGIGVNVHGVDSPGVPEEQLASWVYRRRLRGVAGKKGPDRRVGDQGVLVVRPRPDVEPAQIAGIPAQICEPCGIFCDPVSRWGKQEGHRAS